jgi:hypothetical protein
VAFPLFGKNSRENNQAAAFSWPASMPLVNVTPVITGTEKN